MSPCGCSSRRLLTRAVRMRAGRLESYTGFIGLIRSCSSPLSCLSSSGRCFVRILVYVGLPFACLMSIALLFPSLVHCPLPPPSRSFFSDSRVPLGPVFSLYLRNPVRKMVKKTKALYYSVALIWSTTALAHIVLYPS